MTQDVRPWLREIQDLQEKLATVRQQQEQAEASAANWRQLYETEAQQRRAETQMAQQTIAGLKVQLQQLQAPPTEIDEANLLELLRQEVEPLQRVEDLKTALIQALAECDRLGRTLQLEQAAHRQTRQTLTTALGDTVELLTRSRRESPPAVVSTMASAS
jgi:DNA repair ATPase RecN